MLDNHNISDTDIILSMLLWIFLPGCLLLIMSLIALYCLCYCDSTIAVIKEADKNSGSRLLRAWNRQPQPQSPLPALLP